MSGAHIALAMAKKRIAQLEELCSQYQNEMNRVHDYLQNYCEHSWDFDYIDFMHYIGGEEE